MTEDMSVVEGLKSPSNPGARTVQRFPIHHRKLESSPVHENSPLLDNDAPGGTNSFSGGRSASSDIKGYQDPEHGGLPQSKDYWKILQRHVLEGDLLLRSVAQSPDPSFESRPYEHQAQLLHKDKIQKKIEEIRSGTEFSVWHGVAMIVLYLGISVAFYNNVFEPEWTMLDSVYFAVVTVTTVGYGVEFPTSNASRVFTCFYALSGISILGIALGVIGSNLMDAQEAMARKTEDVLKKKVMSVFDERITTTSTTLDSTSTQTTENNEQYSKPNDKKEMLWSSSYRPSLIQLALSCFQTYLPLMAVMFGMAYVIGQLSEWTILESFYFMIITGTTVGYGDYAPRTEEEKMIGLFFIPIAVVAMGVWLGGVANFIVESRSAQYRKHMSMKELTQQDLEIMDKDGDGKVTRAEFLEFMLIAMNKVDQDLVDELRMHFDRLDADGTGELTKDDLIQVARAKLQSPPQKLRLAMYKKRVLEQGRGRRHGSGLFAAATWSTRYFTGSRKFHASGSTGKVR